MDCYANLNPFNGLQGLLWLCDITCFIQRVPYASTLGGSFLLRILAAFCTMKKCSISKVDEYLPSWNSGSSSYIKQKDECQLVASSENKTKQNTNSRYYCLIVSNSILFRLHHCTWILANLQSDRIPKYFGYGTHAQSFGLCPSSGLGVTLMENTWNLNSQV